MGVRKDPLVSPTLLAPRGAHGGLSRPPTLTFAPTKSPQTYPGTLHFANLAMKWRSAPGPGPPVSPAQCMPPAPSRTCGAAAPPGWFMGPCGRRRPRRVLLLPGRAAGARTMPPPLPLPPPPPPLPPPPAPLRPGRGGGGARGAPGGAPGPRPHPRPAPAAAAAAAAPRGAATAPLPAPPAPWPASPRGP